MLVAFLDKQVLLLPLYVKTGKSPAPASPAEGHLPVESAPAAIPRADANLCAPAFAFLAFAVIATGRCTG